ncbi:uncharacterized [Tachysurus ichikawai]
MRGNDTLKERKKTSTRPVFRSASPVRLICVRFARADAKLRGSDVSHSHEPLATERLDDIKARASALILFCFRAPAERSRCGIRAQG